MSRVAILLGLAGCGAKTTPEVAFDMDRCDLPTLRLVAFDGDDVCSAGVPIESESPSPVDDVTWDTASGEPPRLHARGTGTATVVAYCIDAAGVVRRWGCDDDSDGTLDVVLVDACTSNEAACDPERTSGRGWTGPGGDACVRDCACAAPDNAPEDRPWTEEPADDTASWDHGLAVGDDGTIHLAIYRPGAGVSYRWREDGGDWQETLVDALGEATGLSIGVGDDGTVHIAYYAGGIRHGYGVGAVWSTESIDDTAGSAGIWLRNDLVVRGDEVHVAYTRWIDGDPGAFEPSYAVLRDGTWAWEDVAPRMGVASCPSLAVGPDGAPHVTYQGDGFVLHHATKVGGEWIDTRIDGVACTSDVAVDPGGTAHVAYMAPVEVGYGLRYATDASGVWLSESVDTTPKAGLGPSLVMGPGCTAHVVHTVLDVGALRYASGRAGDWEVGQFREPFRFVPMLALDSSGAFFSTYSGTELGAGLVLATRPGGDGVDQDCDGVDGVDADGDGHASTATAGDDCDDADPAVSPDGLDEDADGVDQNCDCRDGPAE